MHTTLHWGIAPRLALAGLLVALATPESLPAQEQLIVLSGATSEATLVDPNTHEIVGQVQAGPNASELALSPDGRFAYVVTNGSAAAPHANPGSVTVLDLLGQRVTAVYQPRDYRGLHDVQVSSNGRRLWVTSEAENAIVELDAVTGDVLMLWRTGGARSHTVVGTKDLRKLYVANADSDSITVINRQTAVSKRIFSGARPEDLDVSPTRKRLWVANRGDNTVAVINTRKDRPVASLPSGGEEPVRVRFRPDGIEVWVANYGSNDLSIFDAWTREQIGSVGLDAGPWDILFSPDGRRAYVSLPDLNQIVVLDVESREVETSFFAGNNPVGLAWSGDGSGTEGGIAR